MSESDDETEMMPKEPETDGYDDYALQDKDATFVVGNPIQYKSYWSWELDPEYYEKKYEVYKNSKAARRLDIIAQYENEKNKALAKLEEEDSDDSDDDWFVARPLANQKKEEPEADRAVATDKGTRADKRRGKKRKNDDY